MKLRSVFVPFCILGAVASGACSILVDEAPPDDCVSNHNCPPGVDASIDVGDAQPGADARDSTTADGSNDGSGCDLTKSPKDEPCVVADENGVFVDPVGGVDTNAGTKALPVKTLSHALAIATAGRVFVCNGTFAEGLVIAGASKDIGIYGGFACPAGDAGDAGDAGGGAEAWTYVPGSRATIALASAQYALRISDATAAVRIEDIAFSVANGVAPGESSIAAFVSKSANVRLARVKLVAGNGVAGADGVTGSNHTTDPLDGAKADAGVGGVSTPCACGDGTVSQGGNGGGSSPITTPTAGTPGAAGAPGINAKDGTSGGAGHAGDDAPSTIPDGIGAATLGVLTASGWSPSAGTKGGDGKPGQGGGGGGNGRSSIGAGGAGACGGCGGGGGALGTGGGSSFALLTFQSSVNLETSELVASPGGKGGKGGDGEVAQAGGAGGGGFGAGADIGCVGGPGGSGSGGNGGGGGAGGISAAIAHSGTPPTQSPNTTTVFATQPAAGGPGGAAGPAAPLTAGHPGSPGTPGIAGEAKAVKAL